ncbi:MAG: SDR family NAD(P)-dependent oxidoreductase [Sandaracinaceae bacterium]|nr:SDR family NAD(P)-dependent oxidoreductase [Sandaracinaceae bacterium]MDW8246715.1 SDR family NAD(P)-dependent oxidoreductase [Sandaracinaceae bacterium]
MRNSFQLSGSRCVVTGSGDGLGRAIAIELAKRGCRVLVSDIDEEGARATASMILANGAEAVAQRADVRDQTQIAHLAETADQLWGGVDVVVNNAGVAVAGPFEAIPLEQWKYQLEVNFYGVLYGCHTFLPRLLRNPQGGLILNVASMAGWLSPPGLGPYNVSKAAVIALSETLYAELRHRRIHVSVLCPTFLRTNIHERVRAFDAASKQRARQLVTKARWSAEEVASYAIDRAIRGQLYIVPQLDAKLLWQAKRLTGATLHRVLGKIAVRLNATQ